MDQDSKIAEVFTQDEAALIFGISASEFKPWVDQGQLAVHQAETGTGWVASAFDLITACHRRGLSLPPRLQNYAKRVLIAEDDKSMARAIERVLRGAGYTTLVAPDGFQASSVVEAFCPAAIVLDLNMPYMLGLEVLQHLRSTSTYAHIKIIVVSAGSPAQFEEAKHAGADYLLEKPFDNDQLLAVINDLLMSKPSSA